MTQTADTTTTLDVIERFNEVFNKHDVDGIMALMTDDIVFENTSPRPEGERYEGQESVRGFWEQFFSGSPSARFDSEDMFAGAIAAPSAGSTAGSMATASPTMSAAWTSSVSATVRWRRSSRTLRASPADCHSEPVGGPSGTGVEARNLRVCQP